MLTQTFWKKYFKVYDYLISFIPYQNLLEDIVRVVEAENGDLILDVGSGNGNLALKLNGIGAKTVGLDFSEEGLKNHKHKDEESNLVLGDLTEGLPFSDNCFDKIVSNNVIYALDRNIRKKVFKEFYRVLKCNGKIAVANVHKNSSNKILFCSHIKNSFSRYGFTKTIADIIRGIFSLLKISYYTYLIKKEHDQGNYHFMEQGEQTALLEDAGFKLIFQTMLTYANQSYLDVGIKEKR